MIPLADQDPEEFGRRIRALVGVEASEQRGWDLRRWVDGVERLGVLVMQSGDIGPVDVTRGFTAPHALVPIVVLNTKDDARARVFIAGRSGTRTLPRHCRENIEISISAWFNQLPCFGV